MSNLKKIFDDRAKKLTDHDPWRYGKELSFKADLAELDWIYQHIEGQDILDVGCGTGRHCLMLAERDPKMNIYAFDFAPHNIKIFEQEIAKKELQNIQTSVCSAEDMVSEYGEKTFDSILSIGLIQYLDNARLKKHIEDCASLLNRGGVLMIKHPTSFEKTFTFSGYSDLLESEYVSYYRNFQDVIILFNSRFELEKIERVFTARNMTSEELNVIEKQDTTRQMWFLFRKL